MDEKSSFWSEYCVHSMICFCFNFFNVPAQIDIFLFNSFILTLFLFFFVVFEIYSSFL